MGRQSGAYYQYSPPLYKATFLSKCLRHVPEHRHCRVEAQHDGKVMVLEVLCLAKLQKSGLSDGLVQQVGDVGHGATVVIRYKVLIPSTRRRHSPVQPARQPKLHSHGTHGSQRGGISAPRSSGGGNLVADEAAMVLAQKHALAKATRGSFERIGMEREKMHVEREL